MIFRDFSYLDLLLILSGMVPPTNKHTVSIMLLLVIFLALLGLHCCVGFSLVAVISGSSLVPVRELLIAGASLVAEHRL